MCQDHAKGISCIISFNPPNKPWGRGCYHLYSYDAERVVRERTHTCPDTFPRVCRLYIIKWGDVTPVPASILSLRYTVKALCPACQMHSPLHHSYHARSPAALLEKSWEKPWDYSEREKLSDPKFQLNPASCQPPARPAEEPSSWAQLRSQNCEKITIWLLF